MISVVNEKATKRVLKYEEYERYNQQKSEEPKKKKKKKEKDIYKGIANLFNPFLKPEKNSIN